MRMQWLAKYRETGLLLMRVGLGVFFIILTGPMLFAGTKSWADWGEAIRNLGLHRHYRSGDLSARSWAASAVRS